ncbi:MAG: peptidoglycan editing factor PgeF [Sporichthyaceae bacterium]
MLPLVRPAWPRGIRGVFTTRAGGESFPPYGDLNLALHVGDDARTVAANRAAVASAIGLAPERLVFSEQVHGNAVAFVSNRPTEPPVADGLVTTEPGLALVVMVADCVPVLLADPLARVVGVAHAGRRGVELGVVEATVRTMREHGASPGRIVAWIGPAIGACCYEVPADMQATVAAAAPGVLDGGGRTRTGTPSLELRAGVRRQLHGLGVEQVGIVGECTAEDPDQFSYRRDGTTGRFAGLIWLEPCP